MRGDRRLVPPKRGSGDRRFRRLAAQLLEGAKRQGEKGGPGLRPKGRKGVLHDPPPDDVRSGIGAVAEHRHRRDTT